MEKAYNVNDVGFSYDKFDDYKKLGKDILNNQRQIIDEELPKLNKAIDILDGDLISCKWFPIVTADVFISHSHKDFDKACYIAGLLKKNLNLNCFVDSCIWGCSDKLLKIIDDAYCSNDANRTYNYEMRNLSTSYVYNMLIVALTKMIYNTPCLIFLNTSNSILNKGTIQEEKNKTLSPWIATEIEMVNMIKPKPIKKKSITIENFALNMSHEVKTFSMRKISMDNLKNWVSYANKDDPLNELFRRF